MSDQLVKALAFDKQVRLYLVNAKETVSEAQKRHDTWHTASAALGRSLIASLLLAANLKGEDRLSVDIQGSGPLGRILVEADNQGQVRGFVNQAHLALPLNSQGKLDVAGAVGLPGTLTVNKLIQGSSQPYQGRVPLVSGELGEDFTYYMAVSEQTPTAIGLSVLVDKDETVKAAGGFMVQMLPGASEETIQTVEAKLAALPPLSDLLDQGATLEDLAGYLVGLDNFTILTRNPVSFACPCSQEYFGQRLKLLGESELEAMIDEDHGAEVVCHFCHNKYQFSQEDLEEIVNQVKGDKHV